MEIDEKTEKQNQVNSTEEETESYPINYNVYFINCTFQGTVNINQKGVPPDAPDDPPDEEVDPLAKEQKSN